MPWTPSTSVALSDIIALLDPLALAAAGVHARQPRALLVLALGKRSGLVGPGDAGGLSPNCQPVDLRAFEREGGWTYLDLADAVSNVVAGLDGAVV